MSNTAIPLSVCLVGPVPPPAGGMANQTLQLAELLRAEGADVELVAVNAPYKPAVVGKLPVIRALFRLLPYLCWLYRAVGRSQVVHIMANSGWSWHLFAAPAIWIAKLRNKPVLLNYRGGHAEPFFNKQWRFIRPSISRCDAIIVPSAFLQQLFSRYQLSAVVIPNILDQRLFYPAAEEPKQPQIIVTRNLEAIYDIATAIQAFALIKQQLPEARLTIAGSGPQLAALKQLCHQLNISDAVHFAGRLNLTEIAGLYRSASLMLNSSLVDNSPNSVIEAMACKVAVVSTDVGGLRNLVTDKTDALLVSPGNAEQMATAALSLLTEPQKRNAMLACAYQNSQRFHWPAVMAQLQQHYQQLIAKHRRA